MSKVKTFKLNESTVAILGQMANATRYLEAIVQRSHGRWSTALNILKIRGWTLGEIRAAVLSLNAAWEGAGHPGMHAETMSRYLRDGVTRERWAELVSDVANGREASFALDTLAAEYWCNNTILREALLDGMKNEGEEGEEG